MLTRDPEARHEVFVASVRPAILESHPNNFVARRLRTVPGALERYECVPTIFCRECRTPGPEPMSAAGIARPGQWLLLRYPAGNIRQHATQNRSAAPSLKAPMHSFVVRVALRQHVPSRACVENPQHRFEHTTRRNRLSPRTSVGNILLRKMIPDAFPLLVREPNHSTFISDRQQSAILR